MSGSDEYVIIVAGGKGLRMGGDIPKQFLPIAGLPVLMHTIRRFLAYNRQIKVILVLPVKQQDYWRKLCRDYSFYEPHLVADGGETRFHSVKNGLELVPSGACSIVAVHDGVRPFASVQTIDRCFDEARRSGAAVPVVPVVETLRHLKSGENGNSETVPRGDYRLVQTPQTFSVSLLKEAYSQPYTDFFTDDASVVESLGRKVSLVEGNRENIKLTTPIDLAVAETLVTHNKA